MNGTKFNIAEWNGPRKVQTPDVENDIRQYLSADILAKWKTSNDTIKGKIVIIVERLDLISHLKHITKIVEKKTTYLCLMEEPDKIRKTSHCKMFGHDFSGLEYDLDALVYYLYLSCIDAIQSKPNYKSAFDWLKQNAKQYISQSLPNLSAMLKEDEVKYNKEYGSTKNFVKAFIEDIPCSLQQTISENLIVLDFQNGCPIQASIAKWDGKTLKEKLTKIAKTLYDLRSKYTHENKRPFLPICDVQHIPDLNGEHLLCKKGCSVDMLLDEIIKGLCLQKLLISESEGNKISI